MRALTSDANTVEIYGKVGFDVPLSPELSIYYDVDKIKGAYIRGLTSATRWRPSEKVSIDLGAAAGFSAGQGIPDDLLSDESFNFADDGFTHLDLSAGVPFAAGAFSITPVIHVVIAGDDCHQGHRRPPTSTPTRSSGAECRSAGRTRWRNRRHRQTRSRLLPGFSTHAPRRAARSGRPCSFCHQRAVTTCAPPHGRCLPAGSAFPGAAPWECPGPARSG